MISGTGVRLFGGVLNAAASSIYTASNPLEITNISFVPRAAATVILYIVPSGETRGTQHEVYRNELRENETAGFTFMAEGSGFILEVGDQVHVAHNASDGEVTLTMFGIRPDVA